jgi:hypothetical protein
MSRAIVAGSGRPSYSGPPRDTRKKVRVREGMFPAVVETAVQNVVVRVVEPCEECGKRVAKAAKAKAARAAKLS